MKGKGRLTAKLDVRIIAQDSEDGPQRLGFPSRRRATAFERFLVLRELFVGVGGNARRLGLLHPKGAPPGAPET
jgi:hypothetical protein